MDHTKAARERNGSFKTKNSISGLGDPSQQVSVCELLQVCMPVRQKEDVCPARLWSRATRSQSFPEERPFGHLERASKCLLRAHVLITERHFKRGVEGRSLDLD